VDDWELTLGYFQQDKMMDHMSNQTVDEIMRFLAKESF
jgi:hypothetical protein